MIILQALVNGLVSGALLAVPAIGFTAMFAVLRFPNFSVSGVATLGAFAGYLAYGAGLQIAGSLAVAFAMAGAAGLFFDKVAHLPLVKQGALPAAIASIATGLVLENVVRLRLRQRAARLRPADRARHAPRRHPLQPAAARDHGLALAIMLAVFAALAFTRIGKAMRASADNPELAALKGIRPQSDRDDGELRRHGAGRRRRHAARARQLDRSADRHAHPALDLRRRRAGRPGQRARRGAGCLPDRHRRGTVGAGRRLALSRRRRLLRHPGGADPAPARAVGERAF